MKNLILKIFPIIIISVFMLGCYTQMKFAKPRMEEPAAIYVDEDYYYLDSTQAELGTITNIYVYTPPYYYDPWYNPWYDPWYWRPTPRWGWYVGFSFYWGDPYWYPWGWYGRCCYPYVTPYAGYYSPYPAWGYYYYPPYYHHYSPKYAKRPFDRRSPISPRSVARGGRGSGGTTTGQEVAPTNTRNPRGVATVSGTRGSSGESSRIVRRGVGDREQITRSSASSGRSIETRGTRGSSNRSSINSNRSSSRRSSSYKPSSSNRRSSSSSGYNNRRSSSRNSSSYKPGSSSSGSRSSSGRSSSGSSSSSSSGSSSRSSSSGGSRSTSRK